MTQKPVMTPNEEHTAFYMAIGRSVTQWAHIENGLYHIASRIFGGDTTGALAFGFFSIENFRSKLAFVDRAYGTAIFFHEFEPEWIDLREHIKSLSSRRNEIAHGRVIIYPHNTPGRRYAIVPTFAPEPKRKTKLPKPPPGSHCIRDVDLIQRQFSRAAMWLDGLYYRIGGEEDPHGERVPQEPQPQTLASIVRQIHATLPPR